MAVEKAKELAVEVLQILQVCAHLAPTLAPVDRHIKRIRQKKRAEPTKTCSVVDVLFEVYLQSYEDHYNAFHSKS
jgi:hypothetical protein